MPKSMLKTALILSLALVTGAPTVALACATVAVPKSAQKLVGKSYDWDGSLAHVVVNKRHVRKTGLALYPGDRSPVWSSRFGSLTFNEYGREFPNGGINEKGLVVELMWLDSSRFPPSASAPAINELQWIQYQLDNFATVDEMVSRASAIVVHKIYASVHYMACDASGACATFEYVDGKMQVHSGEGMPATALTNSTYSDSLAYLRGLAEPGRGLPQGRGSLARFVRAALLAQSYADRPDSEAVAYVFSILDNIRQGDFTKWNIVYSSLSGQVSFRTRTNPKIKSLHAFALDFRCDTPVLVADIDGDSVAFAEYTEGANRHLIKTGMDELHARFPDGLVDLVAHYPASTQCVDTAL